MLISFQIRQNEEIDGCYEMKAVYIYMVDIFSYPMVISGFFFFSASKKLMEGN